MSQALKRWAEQELGVDPHELEDIPLRKRNHVEHDFNSRQNSQTLRRLEKDQDRKLRDWEQEVKAKAKREEDWGLG